MKPEILFLKQEDVIKAGLLDMKMVLAESVQNSVMIVSPLPNKPKKPSK